MPVSSASVNLEGLITFTVKIRSEPLENSEEQDKQDRKRQGKQGDKRYKSLIYYIILLILPLAILLILLRTGISRLFSELANGRAVCQLRKLLSQSLCS